MPHLKDARLTGQSIELRLGPSDAERWYLGPNLELDNCDVFLWISGRDFILRRPRFLRSRIWAKKPITKVPFLGACFEACQLFGAFRGCDFGSRQGEEWPASGVRECDFRGATLDDCRFISSSIDTLRFAKWPTIVFLDPVKHASDFAALRWPGAHRIDVYARALESSPKETNALVVQAESLVKLLGGDESDLRAALHALPWIEE